MTDIIIPIYTPKPFAGITRCVQSVIDHTTDYNLILVGSDKSQVTNINMGLAKVTSDYAVILDWDVYVSPGWLTSLTKILDDNPKVGIIGAKMSGSYSGLNATCGSVPQEWLTLAGGLMVFRNVGYRWDDRFPSGYWADSDFCRQYKEKGWQVWIHGGVVVEHDIHSSRHNPAVQGYMAEGEAIYKSKWGDTAL